MSYLPCRERSFHYSVNFTSYYASYLRWLRYLTERLGVERAIALWEKVFAEYDQAFVIQVLSTGWQVVATEDPDAIEERLNQQCLTWIVNAIRTGQVNRSPACHGYCRTRWSM